MRNKLILLCSLFVSSCSWVKDQWQPYLFEYSDLSDIPATLGNVGRVLEKGDSLQILCLGNSLTWGSDGSNSLGRATTPWPSVLENRFRQDSNSVRVVNAGVPGSTAADMLPLLQASSVGSSPHLVFVKVGTNDAQRDRSLSDYRADLREIADTLSRRGIDLVFLAPPPMYGKDSRALLEYVRVLRKVALEKEVGFLNLNRKMGQYLEKHDNVTQMIPDGVHYTAKGYTLMADWIYDYLLAGFSKF